MSTTGNAERMLPWAQVDVFAERRYEGNMLAIFHDATGLDTEAMQSLARETNLSETTFILPGDPERERAEGVAVRIFTPDEELPFAGHPTLGTASWIRANHATLRGADEVKLRLKVGTVSVRFREDAGSEGGRAGSAWGEMQQRDPVFGAMPDAALLAAACGLSPEDLHESLPAQAVSTGLPFCVMPLRSVEALERMHLQPQLAELLAGLGAKFVYAITPVGEHAWRTRMPFRGGDDPATGSAAGCAISYLVLHGAVTSGQSTTFHQGQEVRRPSRLTVRATRTGDGVRGVFVGGRTFSVAAGLFTHP